jgi:hypothetical protein
VRPTGKTIHSGDRGLRVGKPETGLPHLFDSEVFGRRQMLANGGDGLFFAGVKRCKQCFGLTTKVIEVGTSWKMLFHTLIWFCQDPQTGSTVNVQSFVCLVLKPG